MFSLLQSRNVAAGSDASAKMFSDQDIHDIFESLPPLESRKSGTANFLPDLILTNSGGGFVTATHLLQSFEDIISKEKNRVSFSALASQLDVDQDVILHLVQACPQLALLSENQSMVIAAEERQSMVRDLCSTLNHQIVDKNLFSKDHNVSQSSMDTLIRSGDLGERVHEIDGHLVSETYQQDLTTEIREKIKSSLMTLEPLTISSSCLIGAPPMTFTRGTFYQLLETEALTSQIIVTEEANSIRFMSRQLIVEDSQKIISELETGTLRYIDKREFASRFDALYTSSYEVDELFAASPVAFNDDHYAISQPYISDRVALDLTSLEENSGYLNIHSDWFQSELPQLTTDKIASSLTERLMSLSSPFPDNLRHVGSILFTSSSYDESVKELFNSTESLAKEQASRDVPIKEMKFHMKDILHAIPALARDVIVLSKDEKLERSLNDHFWATISHVESQNESEFAAFWTKRVVSRQTNHYEALESIEDQKLRDQLTELLSSYIRKELVPDTLSKARSQGLMRSNKTTKNAQRLESSLLSGKKDLTDVLSAVERFEKKQEISGLDTTSKAEAKSTMVADMVRRIQKPKNDGPLLFLTLVVILTARYHPGVVYATGKFAPKLLKQLKVNLSAEDYENLEKWKEMAKSGTLGSEEQKLMAHMVE